MARIMSPRFVVVLFVGCGVTFALYQATWKTRKETTTTRSETTIPVPKVVAGNYESQPISEAEYEASRSAIESINATSRTGKAVSTLRDISGTTVTLQNTWISFDDGLSSLGYPGHGLDALYRWATFLPIRQTNGVISFVQLSGVKEYWNNRKESRVVSVGDSVITGTPIPGSRIHGSDSQLRYVSVPIDKVRIIAFQSATFEKDVITDGESEGWPGDFPSAARLTLVSGEVIQIDHAVLVHLYHGYDERYIPQKPFSKWTITREIPAKRGEVEFFVDWRKVTSIEMGGGKSTTRAFANLLVEGQSVTPSTSYSPVAFIGTTEYGFVHVPLRLVRKAVVMRLK